MTIPLDLAWARRCAADFDAKPTEARARNAAQCLTGLLDALDALQSAYNALAGGRVAPQQPCPGFPQARPEDARLACFKPAGHVGEHSNAPEWLKVGIDPCPARSWDQKTCLKGYMHAGSHEWGGTKTIETGPDLATLGEPEEDPAKRSVNCRCTVGLQPEPGFSLDVWQPPGPAERAVGASEPLPEG